MKYIVVASGLQPSPLDTLTPVRTTLVDRSASTRYSAPSAAPLSMTMLPVQKRPAGSHWPSFMRWPSRPSLAVELTASVTLPSRPA